MFRRRKKPDRRALDGVNRARAQAEEARRAREKVESSTGEIMGEVKAHQVILKRNNFAAKLKAALGGEGG